MIVGFALWACPVRVLSRTENVQLCTNQRGHRPHSHGTVHIRRRKPPPILHAILSAFGGYSRWETRGPQSVLHGIHESEGKNQSNTVSIRSATIGGGATDIDSQIRSFLSVYFYFLNGGSAILADKTNSSVGEPIGTSLVRFPL